MFTVYQQNWFHGYIGSESMTHLQAANERTVLLHGTRLSVMLNKGPDLMAEMQPCKRKLWVTQRMTDSIWQVHRSNNSFGDRFCK